MINLRFRLSRSERFNYKKIIVADDAEFGKLAVNDFVRRQIGRLSHVNAESF